MPRSVLAGSISSPKIDVVIDTGNPFLNRTVDGFLKIGTVAASKVAVEETYHCMDKGSISKGKLEAALKKMCKEGVYWGTAAGVYAGMEYGVERIRGKRDWKNATLGGAISGLLISAASNNGRDKVIKDAITAVMLNDSITVLVASHLRLINDVEDLDQVEIIYGAGRCLMIKEGSSGNMDCVWRDIRRFFPSLFLKLNP
ncbi:Mitochondrial import inner membrane translocase subunit Tim17 [Musa troglodytarum]|uniref:Mitochondrial import inner membrane translocase subunit Tim17 n=1 Tax=Musa troglodytarum TaxID=320322 RepID=A0A9E7I9R6_9LILI|nr:Mitochondrial import inner membrane translocase subunit Tim17 [Musa troglodytarum]